MEVKILKKVEFLKMGKMEPVNFGPYLKNLFLHLSKTKMYLKIIENCKTNRKEAGTLNKNTLNFQTYCKTCTWIFWNLFWPFKRQNYFKNSKTTPKKFGILKESWIFKNGKNRNGKPWSDFEIFFFTLETPTIFFKVIKNSECKSEL